jgi:hypothetical protein
MTVRLLLGVINYTQGSSLHGKGSTAGVYGVGESSGPGIYATNAGGGEQK